MIMRNPPALRFNYPLPYGATWRDGGVLFSLVSRAATGVRVLLYDDVDDRDPSDVISFDPNLNRWGDVWCLFLQNIKPGQLYHFQADGPFAPEQGHRFNGKARLIDPYARALAGDFLPGNDGIVRPPKCVVVDNAFDWSTDRHLRHELSETIIYEAHVRGFTCSPTSGVDAPGTYCGMVEKIPYLKSLGITAIELMPVHEFPTNRFDGEASQTHNYWGYDPLALFAPHRGYAKSRMPGAQVEEFKKMVLAFHQAGIEVILDVVFNHTSEGNELGPTLSLKGLGNRAYYMLECDGRYKNYSGCGNTVNGNHPLMRELIFNCLRYWVQNYHVDGFRFDLASILSRDRNGHLVANPPVLEAISEDPLLADTKIIAEAWDAAGAYQVGSFGTSRWAEWNGRFRDDVRRFWRGDSYTRCSFATRLTGSSDLYHASGRSPLSSINFITAHDGFTLNDLVSYEHKHNEANGEQNRDGENNNNSCNYGAEGETDQPEIEKLRRRQIRNLMASLLLSQGVPMITSGDEVRRTQQGNNNAWCQDNSISWFDWSLVRKNSDLFRFCKSLITFRRSQSSIRRCQFLTGQPASPGGLPDVSWFSCHGGAVEWDWGDERTLVGLLAADEATDPALDPFHILYLVNADRQPREFSFPAVALHPHFTWRKYIDTGVESPGDIYPNYDGPAPKLNTVVTLPYYSTVVYISPRRPGWDGVQGQGDSLLQAELDSAIPVSNPLTNPEDCASSYMI
ncbi:MAG: glycogen debranching protein GlgX [Planctomycetia bacterium]|nr:glycogen debranching protein GlgX [Planctomycetia bacterium]